RPSRARHGLRPRRCRSDIPTRSFPASNDGGAATFRYDRPRTVVESDREKWNARWRERAATPSVASPFVVSLAATLPSSGRALALAGGAGRHAVFLAQRGLAVTLVDVSDAALELAGAAAHAAGVSLATARLDLSVEPLPSGPWDVILCF